MGLFLPVVEWCLWKERLPCGFLLYWVGILWTMYLICRQIYCLILRGYLWGILSAISVCLCKYFGKYGSWWGCSKWKRCKTVQKILVFDKNMRLRCFPEEEMKSFEILDYGICLLFVRSSIYLRPSESFSKKGHWFIVLPFDLFCSCSSLVCGVTAVQIFSHASVYIHKTWCYLGKVVLISLQNCLECLQLQIYFLCPRKAGVTWYSLTMSPFFFLIGCIMLGKCRSVAGLVCGSRVCWCPSICNSNEILITGWHW